MYDDKLASHLIIDSLSGRDLKIKQCSVSYVHYDSRMIRITWSFPSISR